MSQDQIEVSVVLPCLNEEQGIGACIGRIKGVFAAENIAGEIIVADNGSVDRSMEIARSLGCRVFSENVQGYGAAYLCGLRQARGRYIVMGDSDNTYDFGDIPKFLAPLQQGADFVMGSRFKGVISRRAMPWMNRYIGNPILSGMCRLFFKTRLSDIHCGMRAFTNKAFQQMNLHSLGMEFATEMVVAALRSRMKIAEVPINYRERAGKSKLKPLADAWRHIRFMLLFCPLWLYMIPGLAGFLSGMSILLSLLGGPVSFLGHRWDMHAMVFASAVSILSYQVMNIGIFAHIFAINQGFLPVDRLIRFLHYRFSLEKGLILGMIIFSVGFAINLNIFLEWLQRDFGALYRIRESILAMTLLVIGLQTLFSSFFVSLLTLKRT